MALRLTLISHASTHAQKQARFPVDEPVEIDWAARCGELATMFPRASVLCAPELRTRQTAALFSAQPVSEFALRDGDFGDWTGQSLEQIAPDALGQWLSDWQAAPHGGESVFALCQRVSNWMDGLSGTGHIVAVTHPFIIRAAVLKVLHCPPESFHAIDIEPLSAVDVRFNGLWRMRALSLPLTAP